MRHRLFVDLSVPQHIVRKYHSSRPDHVDDEVVVGAVLALVGVHIDQVVRLRRAFAQAGENGKAQVFLEKGGIAALADALRAAQRRLGKRGMDRFDNLKRRIRELIAAARKDYERLTAAAERAKAAAETELAPLRAEIRRLQAA